jgi:hypothetical protein
MTNCRVFGLEPEAVYGDETVTPENFNLDFDHDVDSMDFKLNDEPVTKSFGSRMNKKARAGVMKPTGSIQTSANLQILGHYFYGLLDNYKFTQGSANSSGVYVNTHEFWGGESRKLKSFRGKAVYDDLIFNLYGLLVNSLKLEVASEDMTLSSDFIYKTELAEILSNEDYERVEALVNDLFIMFYDVSLKIDGHDPNGIQTSFTLESNNNHDVDKTIGFGSRAPQGQAQANKRENALSLVTTLTAETRRDILKGRYGAVDVNSPTKCQIGKVKFELDVELCEYTALLMHIEFPACTVMAEFDVSGVDDIETTMNLNSLGSKTVTLKDGTQVMTDMYVKLINDMPEIAPRRSAGSGSPTRAVIQHNEHITETDVQIRVTDGENPISQVEVSIDDITSTTGSAGGCVLHNVPIGEHVIVASKEGYEDYSQTVEVSFEDEITIEMTEER